MAAARPCDLEHARTAKATVRLEIKSTRAGRPGHPMVRVLTICSKHAQQLRDLGFEIVDG